MRRAAIAAVTAAVIASGLFPVQLPRAAAANEPLAPERYNGSPFTAGWRDASEVSLGTFLTDHGAFRVWRIGYAGYVRSTDDISREGMMSFDWPKAPLDVLDGSALAADDSASDDYVVVADGGARLGGGVLVNLETVAAGATAASPKRQVTSSGLEDNTRVAIDVAAEGNSIFLIMSSASPDNGDQELWFRSSPDRGATWSSPIDLQGLSGLSVAASAPKINLVAEDDRVAAVVSEGGEQVVLQSTDAGEHWTSLGDPAPLSGDMIRSPLGLGWSHGELRAAWVTRATAGAPLILMSNVPADDHGWASPETLPSDGLESSARYYAPLVARLGTTTAVQAHRDLLRTRWHEGWLRVNAADSRVTPLAIGSDRFAYQDEVYSPDLRAPRVVPYWSFGSPQGPMHATGFSVLDEGYLDSVQCWIDGVLSDYTDADYPHCYASNGEQPQTEGTHTLRVLATDRVGRTTDKTVTWQVDATPPAVTWEQRPKPWTLDTSARWSWSATDAFTGVRKTLSGQQSGQPSHGVALDWRTTPTSARVKLTPGTTACVTPTAWDRVWNGANGSMSCVTSPTDDGQLWLTRGRLRWTFGKRYLEQRATQLLRPGNLVGLRVDEHRRTRGVALRALTCPTCGVVAVRAGGQTFKVDLHAKRSRLRTLPVPFEGAPTGIRIRVEKVRGGQVLIDGLFVRTTDSYSGKRANPPGSAPAKR